MHTEFSLERLFKSVNLTKKNIEKGLKSKSYLGGEDIYAMRYILELIKDKQLDEAQEKFYFLLETLPRDEVISILEDIKGKN